MNRLKKLYSHFFIFIIFLSFGVLTVLQVHNIQFFPVLRGFDASGHIQYIDYLKQQKKIPLAHEGWEMYQPPLYYLTATAFPNLESVRKLGFLSWLMLSAIVYWYVYLTYNNKWQALLGSLTAATLPAVIYMTPPIGNEFFSAVMISGVFISYYLFVQKPTITHKIVLGLLLGFALLSKATTFVFIIAVILDRFIEYKKNIGPLISNLWLTFLVVGLVGGWFYFRNIMVYGHPFVIPMEFAQFDIRQPPGYRDLTFFIDLKSIFTMDLFRAHHYSLWGGTLFSWVYDGHNVVIPVQPFSKAGIALVLSSIPMVILFIKGYIQELRHITSKNRLLLIYIPLIFLSYIAYNFRLPFYSTVKAIFMLSAVLPWVYFIIKGLNRRYLALYSIYLLIYIVLVVKNFWILDWWY